MKSLADVTRYYGERSRCGHCLHEANCGHARGVPHKQKVCCFCGEVFCADGEEHPIMGHGAFNPDEKQVVYWNFNWAFNQDCPVKTGKQEVNYDHDVMKGL